MSAAADQRPRPAALSLGPDLDAARAPDHDSALVGRSDSAVVASATPGADRLGAPQDEQGERRPLASPDAKVIVDLSSLQPAPAVPIDTLPNPFAAIDPATLPELPKSPAPPTSDSDSPQHGTKATGGVPVALGALAEAVATANATPGPAKASEPPKKVVPARPSRSRLASMAEEEGRSRLLAVEPSETRPQQPPRSRRTSHGNAQGQQKQHSRRPSGTTANVSAEARSASPNADTERDAWQRATAAGQAKSLDQLAAERREQERSKRSTGGSGSRGGRQSGNGGRTRTTSGHAANTRHETGASVDNDDWDFGGRLGPRVEPAQSQPQGRTRRISGPHERRTSGGAGTATRRSQSDFRPRSPVQLPRSTSPSQVEKSKAPVPTGHTQRSLSPQDVRFAGVKSREAQARHHLLPESAREEGLDSEEFTQRLMTYFGADPPPTFGRRTSGGQQQQQQRTVSPTRARSPSPQRSEAQTSASKSQPTAAMAYPQFSPPPPPQAWPYPPHPYGAMPWPVPYASALPTAAALRPPYPVPAGHPMPVPPGAPPAYPMPYYPYPPTTAHAAYAQSPRTGQFTNDNDVYDIVHHHPTPQERDQARAAAAAGLYEHRAPKVVPIRPPPGKETAGV